MGRLFKVLTTMAAASLALGVAVAAQGTAQADTRPVTDRNEIIEGDCTTAVQCYIQDPRDTDRATLRVTFPKKTVTQLRSRTLTVQWETIPRSLNPFASVNDVTAVPAGEPKDMKLVYSRKFDAYVGKVTGPEWTRFTGDVMVAKVTGAPRTGGRKHLATVVSPQFGNNGLCTIVLGTLLTARDTALGSMQVLAAAGSVIELTGAKVPPPLVLAEYGAQLIQVSSIEKTARGDYVMDFVYAQTTDALVGEALDPKLTAPDTIRMTEAELASVANFVTTQGSVNSTTLDTACSLETPFDGDTPAAPSPDDPITTPDIPKFPLAGMISRQPVRSDVLPDEQILTVALNGLYADPSKTRLGNYTTDTAIGGVRVYYDASAGNSFSDELTATIDVRSSSRAYREPQYACSSSPPTQGSVVSRRVDPNTCLTLKVSYGTGATYRRTAQVRMRVASNIIIDTSVSQWTYPSANAWPMATNTALVRRAADLALAQRDLLVTQGVLPK